MSQDILVASGTSVLDSAIDYGRHGWPVFPLHSLRNASCSCGKHDCGNAGKHPRTPHGVQDATTDEQSIRDWWQRWPDANVAVATGARSGIVVLDVDPRHCGNDSLAALEAEHGKLPATVECLTGGGGRHIYFKYREGTIRTVARLGGWPGLDVRGDGGYVLVPPSKHKSGSVYTWELSSEPGTTPVAEVPQWLVTLQCSPGGCANRYEEAAPNDNAISEGWRNTTLTSLAGTMRRRGMGEAAIVAALLEENATRCDPPLAEDEVRRIAGSIARYKPETSKGANGARHHSSWHPSGESGTLASNGPGVLPSFSVIRLSEVKPETVRWLWPRRIPLSKITILDGDPGLGKSLITLDLAARITTGRAMPDGKNGDLDEPAGVLLLSAEDDPADTIRPRLDAAAADVSRVSILTHFSAYDVRGRAYQRFPSIPCDLLSIERAINEVDARLVVIDPLMAFLGGEVKSHTDQDVRRALAPLMVLAERTGAAIVAVRHLNKLTGINPLYRGGGSIGIVGAARSGLLVAKDPNDLTGSRRVLASTKSNLAKEPESLAYHLETDPNGTVRMSWDGVTTHTASTLLAVDAGAAEVLTKAGAFLNDRLSDGPILTKDVQNEGRSAGFSERTLDRAKAALGIKARKSNFAGGWVWELPKSKTVQQIIEGCQAEAKGANSAKGCGIDILGARGAELADGASEGQPSTDCGRYPPNED